MAYDIVIDIGNTRAKTAVFKDGALLQPYTGSKNMDDLPTYITEKEYRYGIISSTANANKLQKSECHKLCNDMLYMSANTDIPLQLAHDTPETLGNDRKAACVGAAGLYPGKNLLVIDAGTAITYDIVSAQGIMEGGNISPGKSIRFKALHNYTGKLPLLTSEKPENILGKTTRQSIINGVQYGFLSEVKWYIEHMTKEYKGLITIITGGDAGFLADNLKNSIFVHSDLVLFGLYRILMNYVETN
ncbi:MAG: type III pantothenate kinase [Bacteroidota bacterium]|nr:type III pantothenate kinase [Bacteroidota bacterium]